RTASTRHIARTDRTIRREALLARPVDEELEHRTRVAGCGPDLNSARPQSLECPWDAGNRTGEAPQAVELLWDELGVECLHIRFARVCPVLAHPFFAHARYLEDAADMILLGNSHRQAHFGYRNHQARSGERVLQCGHRCPAAVVHNRACPVENYTSQLHLLHASLVRRDRPNSNCMSNLLFISHRITGDRALLDDNPVSTRLTTNVEDGFPCCNNRVSAVSHR